MGATSEWKGVKFEAEWDNKEDTVLGGRDRERGSRWLAMSGHDEIQQHNSHVVL